MADYSTVRERFFQFHSSASSERHKICSDRDSEKFHLELMHMHTDLHVLMHMHADLDVLGFRVNRLVYFSFELLSPDTYLSN